MTTTYRVHAAVLTLSLGFVLLLLNTFLFAQQEQHAPGAHSPFKPVATVQQIMKFVTIPASDAIFAAAGEAPKVESEWLAIQNNALLLAESGNLLMLPGRARDNEEWIEHAQGMIDAAMLAFAAAGAQNADKLADAGDKIYETCDTCHKEYMFK